MSQQGNLEYNKLSRGITQAYLLQLNEYAREHSLISKEDYLRMNITIRTDYDRAMNKVKFPPSE